MQDRDYTQMEVAEKLSKAVQKKTMARSFVQQSSSFGGRRGGMPVQYVLQATNIEKLQEVLPKFMAKVYENPIFQMADVDLKFSKPEAASTSTATRQASWVSAPATSPRHCNTV